MTRRRHPKDYRVAVPSYQRSSMLKEKTLAALAAGGVDPSRITVFVHGHDPQLHTYRELAARARVAIEVTGANGINAQRAAILAHYPPGTPLVQVDDDLTCVVEAVDAKTLRPVQDLDGFLRGMFLNLMARDLWVWGLSPTANAFYMRPGRISEGLKFLMFAAWGCFTRPGHPVHTCTVPTKDDYELSLRAWWYDGATVRHDGAAARADIYTAPGGCQLTRKPEHAEIGAAKLIADWPGLVRRNPRRNSPYTEILLTPRPRHRGRPASTPLPGEARRREVAGG